MRRRHRHERLQAVLVGVTLVGAVLTSVAIVAGAGGRSRSVYPERDPLRERIEADLEVSTRAMAQLAARPASASAAAVPESCRAALEREAGALLDILRADVEAFHVATRHADTIARLRAADRARADVARLQDRISAPGACP